MALIVILLGTSTASWIFSSDVTFVPVIARDAPELFKEIFTTGHVLAGALSVVLWIAGNVLFAASVVRARVFPTWPAGLLAVGSVFIPIAYFAGWSVRVVALGAFAAGLSEIWLGYSLLQTIRSLSGVDASRRAA